MPLSRYLKIYPCPDLPGMNLVYSTLRSSSVLLPDQLLAAAEEGTLADGDRETLTRLGMLVPDLAEERQRLRTIFEVERPGTPFTAVVVLNLDCNLACPYCYEANFRGRHYMTTETARLLVDCIQKERIALGQPVQLSFYGGEPLLSLDLIRQIARPLQQAARQQDVSFGFSLVTNGTLLSRGCAEELVQLGLNGAKITLDGPAEQHDRSRPFASGSGSYETIMRNILAIYQIVPLQLGGNYTRENYGEFPAMLDDLLGRGLDPARVAGMLFAPVTGKAGESGPADFNEGCACDYEPWLMEASIYLREETLRRGFPAPKLKLSACLVELEHSLVIGHDGLLYKCPAFMAWPELCVGTLADGVRDYAESHKLELWKTEECLECAYLPLCFGGCRHMAMLRSGAMDRVDCRREYYDNVLETIVRQDLQYQPGRK
jgi:uncharacterized protein